MNQPNLAYADDIDVAEAESEAEAIPIEDTEAFCKEFWEEAQACDALESIEEEAMRSLENYKRTGLHVTWEELKPWLESWGTPDELDPPKCHT